MSRYSIVENPGDDSEDIVESGLTYEQAVKYLRSWYRAGERVDIMKEGPEGLTTEF